MSLELVSKTVETPRTRYDQVVDDTVTSKPDLKKVTTHGKVSKNERFLTSTNSVSRTSATKSHIAFNLSFKIKIENRTPFDPKNPCR